MPTTGDREGDGVGLAVGDIVGWLCYRECHGKRVSSMDTEVISVDKGRLRNDLLLVRWT